MEIQVISVDTKQGIKEFSCILRNEKESIFQIVDDKGENNPQSLEFRTEREVLFLIFNGLRVVGSEVFTFNSFSTESQHIGAIV